MYILNSSLIPNLKVEAKEKIVLESPFIEKIQADLVTLSIYYKSPNNGLFASNEKLNINCLITPDIYSSLTEL